MTPTPSSRSNIKQIGDVAQWLEGLPGMHKALGRVCNPCAGEVEAGGPGVQGHPRDDLQATLDYRQDSNRHDDLSVYATRLFISLCLHALTYTLLS